MGVYGFGFVLIYSCNVTCYAPMSANIESYLLGKKCMQQGQNFYHRLWVDPKPVLGLVEENPDERVELPSPGSV
jgi:hypothetical protein